MNRIERLEQYAQGLSVAEREGCLVEFLRELARTDLFFLLTRVLNRADADRDWLFDRCNEVQAAPDGYLDLWAREHYKSTIITFALTIQEILKNPEITIGIFSHTRPIAKGFLRQIKREFELNEHLKALFPEVLYENPRKESPKWSEDDGIVVRRATNPKEATVEAWGLVDGQPTSKHYALMIYDDVVTRESVTTPDMIAKTTDAWALSRNLSSEQGGLTRYIGTRYHANDTWAEIIRRKAAVPRLHPPTDNGKADGTPVLLTPERLAKKREEMGPYIFACQMLQDPKQDAVMGFKREWLRFWRPAGWEGMNRYVICDPASEKKKTSDYTVFAVLGLAADRNYYLIDMIRDRLNLTERARTLFYLHQKYRPLMTGYEKYGLQSDIEHFNYVMEQNAYRFPIIELGGSMSKNDRIRRLVPIFESGRLYIPDHIAYTDYEGHYLNLSKIFTEDEYEPFPVSAHDDMLDALSRVMDQELTTIWPVAPVSPIFQTPAQQDWQNITGQAPGPYGYSMAVNIDD